MSLTSAEDRIAKALADQEAALWLGPGWSWEGTATKAQFLAGQNWLGIWSESRDPSLGQFLEGEWRGRPFGRTFVEVPDQVHEVLDREFLFSRVCPFFYLAGRGTAQDPRSKKGRLLVRAAHVQQLERLGQVTLLVGGCRCPDDLENLLADDLETARGCLRRIIVTGVEDPSRWQEQLAGRLSREELERVDLHRDLLQAILERISAQRQIYGQAREHVLLVGSAKRPIPLTPLLRTDPPIDQYFHILTGKDLRPAEEEEQEGLLVELLSGQAPPWRAFRHELHWRRPQAERLSRKALETLEHMRQRSGATVVCVDVEGDSGSGLTTALQMLAFHAADHGFPTLVARSGIALEFDVLRTFMVDLERRLSEEDLQGVPVVVVLDAPECDHDPRLLIKDLPLRLRRESRRVLLVRGTHSANTLRTPEEMVARFTVPPFRQILDGGQGDRDAGQLDSLIDDWVRPVYGRVFHGGLEEKIDDVRRWAAEGAGATGLPLLACLYLILHGNDRLREAANLGRHLLGRLARHLDLTQAPTRAEAAGAVSVLAALARFRQAVPRRVLQNLLGLDPVAAYRLIYRLQESDFVWAELLTDIEEDEGGPGHARRLMPASYYRDVEPVGLVHALYGEMLLESLGAGTAPLEHAREDSALCAEILEADDEMRRSGERVYLLRPIFRRLQAGVPLHRRFAEELSMQILREDREPGDREPAPSAQLILEAHDWIPAALVEHSGPLLHSRALARKNRPFQVKRQALPESRQDFQGAADDLNKALELEESRPGGEDLGNLKTSLGLVHRNWAQTELRHPSGDLAQWQKQVRLAETTLREAYEMTRSTYPAHALARWLLDKLRRHLGLLKDALESKSGWFPVLSPADIAGLLGEVMVLLSDEPDLYFRDRWNETRRETFELLGHQEFERVVQELKGKGDEMGYVVQALRLLPPPELGAPGLRTWLPREPVAEGEAEWHLRQAIAVLEEAQELGGKPSGLGNLLRYALFSALPERARGHRKFDPAYRQRYHLLHRLAEGPGEMYLNDPVWRYDLAMLSFQLGHIGEGVKHFRELRRGRRYALVPITRAADWVQDPDARKPVALVTQLQIVRIDRFNDRGWGRLVDARLGYHEEIPFRISLFTSRAVHGLEMFQPGRKIDCRFHLRPAGPYAVPPDDAREVGEGTEP
jgi:hypothetical protein